MSRQTYDYTVEHQQKSNPKSKTNAYLLGGVVSGIVSVPYDGRSALEVGEDY